MLHLSLNNDTMKILLTIISTLLTSGLFSQVTVNAMSLPDVGDELDYTVFAEYQDTVSYRMSGEDMEWSFDSFNAVNSQTEVYSDITTTNFRDSFPEANILLAFGGFESAAIKTDSSLAIVGIIIEGIEGFGIELNVDLEEPFRLRETPFEFGDIIEDAFEVEVGISASIIPGIDSFDIGIPNTTIDSIRVTADFYKKEEAIGWGTLNIIGQEKEVLQIQENSRTNTTIEIGANLFGNLIWIDAAAFLGDMLDDFGGNQTTVSYKFLTASDKRSVIEFEENRVVDTLGNSMLVVNGRTSAEFLSATQNIASHNFEIEIYPNPADNYFLISTQDILKSGRVSLYTISGLLVFSAHDIHTNNNIDISSMIPGTYILHYNSGEGSAVKKLIIE